MIGPVVPVVVSVPVPAIVPSPTLVPTTAAGPDVPTYVPSVVMLDLIAPGVVVASVLVPSVVVSVLSCVTPVFVSKFTVPVLVTLFAAAAASAAILSAISFLIKKHGRNYIAAGKILKIRSLLHFRVKEKIMMRSYLDGFL